SIWHNLFFDPIYNLLIFFVGHIRDGDVGLAIIGAVIVVKTLLLPISIKAVKTQKIMKEIEPSLKEIKEKYKDNKEEQAKAMMAIYKDAGMNPMASVFLVFLQIPIIIALYFAVYSGGGVALPEINTSLLYSWVATPVTVSMNFLGLLDITERSIVLAAAAGITQFFQIKLSMPALKPKTDSAQPNFKDEFARNMQLQMRYVMPFIIFVVAYSISAAIALYFFVSNIVTLLQEFYVKKHR
ncbi:membrane protein insertase YidC, partial [Candidatus Kaiserbacteria bacterium]|nr:membrane protein insertase YidC [Candidatus Kaiserbacteria bacterium]